MLNAFFLSVLIKNLLRKILAFWILMGISAGGVAAWDSVWRAGYR
jgi:hypothetical protein